MTDFCASLLEKFKLDEARDSSNDLAAIAFQLKKMKFTRNPDIYIYLEKNLLFFGVDKMPMASLIPLMQSFKINYLHSQELFRATMLAVHRNSQGFQRLELHEVAMVVGQLGSFGHSIDVRGFINDL